MKPEIVELIRKIRILEVAARKNVGGLMVGEYLTSVRGKGLEFVESRKYVAGESARRIDWNITARVGEPYVRVHQDERQRDVFLALDVSPSMHTGFQDRTKLEYAVELAATLALSIVDGGDRLGHVIFADEVLDRSRARPGRSHLFRVLKSILASTAPWTRKVEESDPRTAIHAIQHTRGRRFVVFLISDFIDHDLHEDLKYVQARHDVNLLHVYDPVEYADTSRVVLTARSPERSRRTAAVRPDELASLEKATGDLRRECGDYRIWYAALSTAMPVRAALDRFFHFKRRHRR